MRRDADTRTMSCASAAGYLARHGAISESEHAKESRGEQTQKLVLAKARYSGRVCPMCQGRFNVEVFEMHLLIAHPPEVA